VGKTDGGVRRTRVPYIVRSTGSQREDFRVGKPSGKPGEDDRTIYECRIVCVTRDSCRAFTSYLKVFRDNSDIDRGKARVGPRVALSLLSATLGAQYLTMHFSNANAQISSARPR
jgi:hypothetical protein